MKPANALKERKQMNSNTTLLLITIVLFFVLYAAGCVAYASKGFTTVQTFLNVLRSNAGLICVACGMTCVMLTGGIDISVGSLIAMDCMIIAYGLNNWGWASAPSITAEADQTFYDMANFRIYLPFGGTINRAGKLIMPYVGIGVVIALAVLVVIFLMLRYTKFGRALYAVGGSEQSAAMMGLNVKATKMKAYVLSSFLCSIGGICYCMNTMSASVNQATGLEMDAIASSVIGGTLLTGGVGNVIGTLFGVLINGTIASIVQFNGKLASSWPNVLTAALLCFFIVLQSIFAKIKERNK